METKTFSASATFPEASVLEFAKYIGYEDTVSQPVLDDAGNITGNTQVPNPISPDDFVAAKFKDYCVQFAAGYEIQKANSQIELSRQATLKQVQDAVAQAITVTVQ